ncbi:hypothetical protein GTY65_24090 [Streptomyces sp. SID8379]|uniref:hypothetical protein n=1 Tax=unclassified Streptomyces TaxID=2593676 RepID=UPI00036B97B8|nr:MULTISPECIES: hypothetical protein [unclassified Streptomyces]MYW67124.1 hypothetical protein [Streptomyces sp. SID8379]
MANFLDDQTDAKRLATLLADYERRLQALERSTQAGYTSIEGGSLDIYDDEGTLKGSVGVQEDGTVALVPVNSGPPPTPTAPAVSNQLAGLQIGWDGAWADSYTTPADFALVQVHVGRSADFTPDLTTQLATIGAALGGTVTVKVDNYEPVWVRLVAENTAAVTGPASDTVQGTPQQAVGQDLIDGIITENKLAEAAVTEAKVALQAISNEKLQQGAVNDLILADDAVTEAKIATGAVGSAALADGAVLADKLAKASVTKDALAAASVSLNSLTGALGDSIGQRYTDTFRDPTVWEAFSTATGATWAVNPSATGTPSGGGLLIANGDVQLAGKALIAQDTDTLYRVMVRVRATAQDASGPATVYLGAIGVADDGTTLVNRSGAASTSMHYYCASNGGALAVADGWKTYVGYIQGRVTDGATAPSGPQTDPRVPGATHASVRFLRPTVWLNFGKGTAAVMEVDAFTIEPLRTGVVGSSNLVAGSVNTAALAADAVVAGKVAADAITGREIAANSVSTSELVAGAVTTDKLTVVGGANVLNDPSFEGAYAAALAAKFAWAVQDLAFGNASAASMKVTTDGTAQWRAIELALLPVTAGDQLYIAADYYASADWAGSEVNVHVRWETEGGTTLATDKGSSRTTTPSKGAWARLAATYTAPATATRARVRIETGLVTAGATWFDNAACRPVVGGVQIADGAITTPKMIANSIQGDRIAVGTLNGDRVVAGSITTSQLSVTTAASVVQKLYDAGAEASKWRSAGSSTTTTSAVSNLTSVTVPDAQSGGYVMRAVGAVNSVWRPDILIPFDPNVLYRISVTVRQTVASTDTAQQRFYCGVAGIAADGATLVNIDGNAAGSSQHYVAAAQQPLTAGAGWQRYTGYLRGYAAAGAKGTTAACPSPTAPGALHANARYITPLFYANYQTGTGTAEIDMITVEVLETGAVQTINIADGAITAPKILAGSVTTDKLVALSVTAEKIASLAITTDKLAALSVTAAQLAANSVTATKILAGSIDATHIKVGSLTADRLALGTDGNVIADPSFEGALSDQRVASRSTWSIVAGNGTPRAVQTVCTAAAATTQALQLAALAGMPGQKVWLSMDYLASADWAGESIRMYATWLNSSNTALGWSTLNITPAVKGTWTTVSTVPTTPAPTGTTQMQVWISAFQATTGTIAFDNVSCRVVMASGAIAGARAEVSPQGLQLFDDSGDEAVALVTGRPNYLTLSTDGTPVATIDQDGGAGFQRLAVADTVSIGGSDLADVLAQFPRGIQAIDYQISTRTTTGTEMGFVELGATIDTSRMYRFVFTARANPSSDGGELRLRLRDGGTGAPTINSPQIYVAVHHQALGNSFTAGLEHIASGPSLGAGDHRFLISFENALAPSGQSCELYGGADNHGVFYVEDIGPYIPETGGYNNGGGTSDPIVKQYEKTYTASWSGTYANRGSYNSYYGSKCIQGYYSSTNGTQAALIGFPSSLASDLAGATIVKAQVYIYFDHWYANAGGKAVIKAHSHTSRPSSFSSDSESKTISWARNEGKWVDITSVFDSTKWRGIALDPNSSSSTYYGIARGVGQSNPPKLKVTYTK